MTRLAILFSFLFLPLGCKSVVEHEERYPGGQIAKAGRLVGGRQEGPWTYYYESGELKAQGPYHDDLQEGAWTYWYPSGQKEMEGELRGERRTGLWRYWHSGGELRAEGRFQDGRESGEWTFWTESGSRAQRGDFAEGKRHLYWQSWYPDEKPETAGFYFEGARVGPWRFWDEAGTERVKRYSLPPGLAIYEERWPSGALRRAGFLQEDVPTGSWASWHENGHRRLAGSFENGTPDGEWTAFDERGELIAVGEVKAGRLMGQWRFKTAEAQELAPRDVGMRPPPIWSGEWTTGGGEALASPEARVEAWLAEITSERTSVPVFEEVAEVALEVAVESALRAPIRPQPWTVRELDHLEDYVDQYTTGDSERLRRSSFYAPESNEPGTPRRGDVSKSRALIGRRLPVTRFETANDGTIDLDPRRGQRRTLVVILRGFAGQVCVYCATQTKALAPSLSRFEALGTDVVIVYPGPESGMDAFVEAYVNTFDDHSPPPYALLYDPDLRLAEGLGLTGNLAIPTTLILDEEGVIQWAYVGKSIDDRPSTKQILEALTRMR